MTDNELIKLAKNGNKEAINELYNKYSKYIQQVTRKIFENQLYIDMDDLLQESFIIFVNAINKFDDTKNTKFTSFLYNEIFYNKRDMLEKYCGIIKVPYVSLLNVLEYQTYMEDHPCATDEEIIKNLKLTNTKKITKEKLKRIRENLALVNSNASYDNLDTYDFMELRAKDEFNIEEKFDNELLKSILSKLDQDEKTIIYMYFGIDCERSSIYKITRATGIQKKNVQKILNSTLRKIKEKLLDGGY